MRRYYPGMLVLSLALVGCGANEEKKNTPSVDATKQSTPKKSDKDSTATAKVEGWGNVKGQVVFVGEPPVRQELKLDKDQEACTAHGPLLDQKYVVDKDTKGVRWAIVWLQAPQGKLPVKPELKDIKEKKVVIDQPFCQFEPHVLALQQGQELEIKNSAKISHNTKIDGGIQNPNFNEIIPPGGSKDVTGFKASNTPIRVSCTIHGWMNGYIRVFNNPYFAVTDEKGNFEIKDAPAGTWNLVVWQEEKGLVNGKDGQPVTIEPGKTAEQKVELKP